MGSEGPLGWNHSGVGPVHLLKGCGQPPHSLPHPTLASLPSALSRQYSYQRMEWAL